MPSAMSFLAGSNLHYVGPGLLWQATLIPSQKSNGFSWQSWNLNPGSVIQGCFTLALYHTHHLGFHHWYSQITRLCVPQEKIKFITELLSQRNDFNISVLVLTETWHLYLPEHNWRCVLPLSSLNSDKKTCC